MLSNKRILICPLNWGLGHATRCIPIIHLLLQQGATVIIAADGPGKTLLKNEFPQIDNISFKGANITYGAGKNKLLEMLLTLITFLKSIKKEHAILQKIVRKNKIDVVISDNRYGAWSPKTKNIFITHQLMLKAPFFENILHQQLQKQMAPFDEIWVPDNEGKENLSGDLSHKYPIDNNTFFVGPLSRFNPSSPQEKQYDIAVIISGPEPQRSIFEQLMLQQLKNYDGNCIMVCGKPKSKNRNLKGAVEIHDHLNSKDLQKVIEQSDLVIARSGYSTIMDLAALGKKAIFVPTPGQTEQEYLAHKLQQEGAAYYQHQDVFDLKKALAQSKIYSGFKTLSASKNLATKIAAL